MGNKKISDIVIELESKVNKISEKIDLIDINVKSLLNKFNLLGKQQFIENNTNKELTQLSQNIAAPNKPILINPKSPENLTLPTIGAVSERKSVVQQQILYADGRPVVLCEVTISDNDLKTNILAKLRTNSHGKWHSSLFSGKYFVTVIKGPTSTKPAFKIEYEITVPSGGQPVELQGKQVE